MTQQLPAISVGLEIPVIQREPTRTSLIKFAGVAEDYARQHWDHPYMVSLGFPDVIVHGWLTLTYMCQAVTEWLPPEFADIIEYEARHKRPTFPGLLTCGGAVTDVQTDGRTILSLDLWAKNEAGEVTTSGVMRLALV